MLGRQHNNLAIFCHSSVAMSRCRRTDLAVASKYPAVSIIEWIIGKKRND
jgi:hypothetical protein